MKQSVSAESLALGSLRLLRVCLVFLFVMWVVHFGLENASTLISLKSKLDLKASLCAGPDVFLLNPETPTSEAVAGKDRPSITARDSFTAGEP